jgi:hypothetical protein
MQNSGKSRERPEKHGRKDTGRERGLLQERCQAWPIRRGPDPAPQREQMERYQGFVEGIVKDLHPEGDLELHLAQRIADIQFRLEMLRTAEFKIYMGAAILSRPWKVAS